VFLNAIKTLLHRAAPVRAESCLSVAWDDEAVHVRVIQDLEPFWNQDFRWAEVRRVCIKDEGLSAPDIIFIGLVGREKPAFVFSEAKNGPEFIGELVKRGLFPVELLAEAMGSSSGDIYCWPPNGKD
jgi:hypothetical protein